MHHAYRFFKSTNGCCVTAVSQGPSGWRTVKIPNFSFLHITIYTQKCIKKQSIRFNIVPCCYKVKETIEIRTSFFNPPVMTHMRIIHLKRLPAVQAFFYRKRVEKNLYAFHVR